MNSRLRLVLRVLSWPFTSELYLFFTLSTLMLLLGIFESSIHTIPTAPTDATFEQDHPNEAMNMSERDLSASSSASTTTSSVPSMLEMKSVFVPAVMCLFGVIFLSGKLLFFLFFDKLADAERTHLSHLLFKFVILRSIILSGAISVARLFSVFVWLLWFSVLGILQSFALIASARCNQYSSQSAISRRSWLRLSFALVFLLIANTGLILGGWHYRYLLADCEPTKPIILNGMAPGTKIALGSSLKTPTALGVLTSRIMGRKEPFHETVDVVTYIAAESVLLFLLVVHLIGGLLIRAYDTWNLNADRSWPQQAVFKYYLDLIYVLVYHFIEIMHYLHLLLWCRIFSVASLIVFLHIRSAYSLLSNRIQRHASYRRLSQFINENFKLCTSERAPPTSEKLTPDRTAQRPVPITEDSEIANGNDETSSGPTSGGDHSSSNSSEEETREVCAICWEPLSTWRRLPCRHDFHEPCLRNWLEQNPSCPTCRRDLDIPAAILTTRGDNNNNNGGGQLGLPTDPPSSMGILNRNVIHPPHVIQTPLSFTTRVHRNQQQVQTGSTLGPMASHPGVLRSNTNNQSTDRNLFHTAVGLNLGLTIGSSPVVAAQAAQSNASAPMSSSSVVTSQSPSGPGANTSEIASTSMSSERGLPTTTASTSSTIPVDVQNQNPAANNHTAVAADDNGHVRRRSFHFDGSRYFSWLPSFHVEMSEVIRDVFTGSFMDNVTRSATEVLQEVDDGRTTPEAVAGTSADLDSSYSPDRPELIRLPPSLRVPAQGIGDMFPQFPLSVIVTDLLQTRVPEETVENLIHRPPPTSSRSSAVWNCATTSSTPPADTEVNHTTEPTDSSLTFRQRDTPS